MLSRPGLRDDALFAHPLGQQGLAERVVDLVRSGMRQVLALQVNLRAAEILAEARRMIEGRGPANVLMEQVAKTILKSLVALSVCVGTIQFVQGRHQRLGHELPPEATEIAFAIHAELLAARMKARTFWASFCPGRPSTPLATSTPQGLTIRIAVPTLYGVSPPASRIG